MRLNNCPYCSGKLKVKEYQCTDCNLILRGDFEESGFAHLSQSQLDFIQTFLIVQGNIKEMEKRLNISYPTVKNRLSEIIQTLGCQNQETLDYMDILHDLGEGFIDVDEALDIINTRRKKQ